jgi:hypothetical protein
LTKAMTIMQGLEPRLEGDEDEAGDEAEDEADTEGYGRRRSSTRGGGSDMED